jgi:hypothetical protein
MLVETQERDVLDCAYVESNKYDSSSIYFPVLLHTRNHVCHVFLGALILNAGSEEMGEAHPQPLKH